MGRAQACEAVAGLIYVEACQLIHTLKSISHVCMHGGLRFKDMLPGIRDSLEASAEEFAEHLEDLEMNDTVSEKFLT